MTIDTRKVKDRRTLRCSGLADFQRDLDALEAAHKAGTLRKTGNWTPGMIFTHLAAFIDYGYNGYPAEMVPPWFIKPMIRLMRNRWLAKGFPPGVKIPRIEAGTVGAEDVSFEEGIARLRASIARLEREPQTVQSPAFGLMPHDQAIALTCRHAELHLSFLHPR